MQDIITTEAETEYTGTASYSPEDNKLRLYVGRVSREEYLSLKEEGWTSTPKQDCDFVATWTPTRRNTALKYAGIIDDEDTPAAERAADRAERFSGYRDKRLGEAVGYADRYDSQPQAHGFQNYGKAVRAADRHDRIGTRACDSWSKAEYWQRRTAGVISNALYKSTPAVRMGRIKEIEADLRKREKEQSDWIDTYAKWEKVAAMEDGEQKTHAAVIMAGFIRCYTWKHPRPETVINSHVKESGSSLCTLMEMKEREYGTDDITATEACEMFFRRYKKPEAETEWIKHYKLRLAYENQMIEAQGGRAAMVEMEVGGWIGGHQIRKINKSPATGAVVSVNLKCKGDRWGRTTEGFHEMVYNIERLSAGAYRAPTDEDRESLKATKKAEKAAAPVKESCPLINPTDEDAERLQAMINERHAEEYARQNGPMAKYLKGPESKAVVRMTQADYSAVSKGTYARAQTSGLCANAEIEDAASNMYSQRAEERKKLIGKPFCKIRLTGYAPMAVIIISDKPQRSLPAAIWKDREVATSKREAFDIPAHIEVRDGVSSEIRQQIEALATA